MDADPAGGHNARMWRALFWVGPRPALAFAGFAIAASGCATDALFRPVTGVAVFEQGGLGAVDVLWVIDDSSPFMVDVQQRLAAEVPVLTGPLLGIDVQMAVVTTTLGAPYDPFAFSDRPDDVERLTEALLVGSGGSDLERGLQAAADVLTPDLGFVRPEAHLVIVFVSDEEDCSDGGQLTGQVGSACYTTRNRLLPVADFVQDFTTPHLPFTNRTSVVSIGAVPTSACGVVRQERYARVARATGGVTLDICAETFTPHLEWIGEIASGLRQGFQLPEPAQVASLLVMVDGAVTLDYAYRPDTWVVQFPRPRVPPLGSTIEMAYQVDPSVSGTDP